MDKQAFFSPAAPRSNAGTFNVSPTTAPARDVSRGKRKLSRDTVLLIGDLLPLIDFTSVLLAAWFGTMVYATFLAPGWAAAGLLDDGARAALVAAVLAPLILCDRAFVSFANGGHTAALLRCYAVRFVMFAGVVGLIGLASRSLHALPGAWLLLWLASSLLITGITRLALVGTLRRLERNGTIRETIAVVGAGPLADRLIRHLQETRPHSVEILGVFDDREHFGADAANPPAGTIADLVDLGKSRPLDWILLAHPAAAEASSAERTRSIVHRLKALAVPVALCPQDIGDKPLSLTRLATDESHSQAQLVGRWDSLRNSVETVVPRWIITLLSLPLLAVQHLLAARRSRSATSASAVRPARMPFHVDNYDLGGFTQVAARFGQTRFGYAVTANADHLIRLHREPSFRALYADAAYVLLDSRFIAHLLRFTRSLRLPVCTGSDLTANLLGSVIAPDDRLVLIGGSAEQAARLAQRYGLKELAHFNPPMGFIRDPAAVEACLQFVEAHSPFRFCLLAVGCPQQEMLAQRLKERGIARGMALCIGASINFLTGEEQRAPQWMQGAGLEWLFRLMQAPGRMAGRYLVRGPQLFGLLLRTEVFVRRPAALPKTLAAPQRRTVAVRANRPRATFMPPTMARASVRRVPAAAHN